MFGGRIKQSTFVPGVLVASVAYAGARFGCEAYHFYGHVVDAVPHSKVCPWGVVFWAGCQGVVAFATLRHRYLAVSSATHTRLVTTD